MKSANFRKNENLPLIVIVGPTASGKTSLAIELAEICGGEIICADSRTIYKGLDIGTAKPTEQDRSRVKHWGLDLVNPNDYFSVADFKKYAISKIDEIKSRGHIPFLVGGTGLYVDAVILDYQFGKAVDLIERKNLNNLTLQELYDYCTKHNVTLPENKNNKRYVVRAIEQKGVNVSKRDRPAENTIVVGISTDRDILRTRIEQRSEQLFDDGVVEEAKVLGKKYGWDSEALKSNIYPLIHSYLLGNLSLEDVKKKYLIIDWRLAKRQLTWLRRNQFINWLSINDAKKNILNQLAKLY